MTRAILQALWSAFLATLALISAFLHASWNALLKTRRDQPTTGFIVVVNAMIISALLACATRGWQIPRGAWLPIAMTALCEGIYFVTLLRALAALPLSSAYGISRGLGVLLMWPASALWLHEDVSTTALGGALLLTFGLFLTIRRVPRGPGVGWALCVCALAVGVYPLTYKRALEEGAPKFSLFALSLAGSLFIQFWALPGSRREKFAAAFRESPLPLFCFSLRFFVRVSFLIWLYALEKSGAAHVAALRNVSVLFATMLGFAQGEEKSIRAVIAAAGIAAGAAFITWH